ncbi:MAG: hypothetical protein AAGK14_00625 [Verrucomicrobiota bacterium]
MEGIRKRRLWCALAASFLGLAGGVQAQIFMGMPDLKQQGFGPALPGDGFAYCGPTAAANVLLWIKDHRMAEVYDRNQQPARVRDRVRTFELKDAVRLVRQLGRYMDTDSKEGTPPKRLVHGLAGYFKDHGLEDCQVRYQGARPVSGKYRALNGPPRIDELRRSVGQGTFALLNLGWYVRQGQDWIRVGGHWVTFTGWQQADGQTRLLVHDPSSRPYWKPSKLGLRLQAVPARKLIDPKDGWALDASGYWRLLGPIERAPGSDYAVLEGVVYIEPGGQRTVARR